VAACHPQRPGQAARWTAVLGLILWRWASGWPSAATGWVPVAVVALLFLLPDAGSVAFGGVTIEIRRTREDLQTLTGQVLHLQQLQVAAVSSTATGNRLSLTFTDRERDALVGSTAAATAVAAADQEGRGFSRTGRTRQPLMIFSTPGRRAT
jgi:hypothetical protein